MSAAVTDPKARVAELKERQAERDRLRDQEKAALDLEVLELVDRFETELGRRGVEFEVVSTTSGNIVVKLGPDVLYKKFQASMPGSKDPTPEDIYAFVAPQVAFPTKAAFDAIIARRAGIALRCANALAVLHGAKEGSEQGKF